MDGKKSKGGIMIDVEEKANELFREAQEMSLKKISYWLCFVYGYMIAKMDEKDIETLKIQLEKMKEIKKEGK